MIVETPCRWDFLLTFIQKWNDYTESNVHMSLVRIFVFANLMSEDHEKREKEQGSPINLLLIRKLE